MDKANGKAGTVDVSDLVLGQIDVPPWVVQQRIDLANVKSFMLESHHGIPKEVQGWLGMTKDVNDCPAYLTTMLEHQGAGRGVGLHQRFAEKLGAAMSPSRPSWTLRMGRPPLSDDKILEVLAITYEEAGLANFWEVCNMWKNIP
jgi:hypothetical protein